MPQIAQLSTTLSSQVFWILIIFGLVFLVIGRGMVPKVMATVEARDGRISADLAAADAARKAADAAESAWREQADHQRAAAHDLIAKAKLGAARATEQRLAEAGATIDAHVARADERIAGARTRALGEIESVAGDAAAAIVARLTGVTIDPESARAAARETLRG